MTLKEVQLVTVNGENYILSEDSNSELFVCSIDGKLSVFGFEELLDINHQWAKPILIEPDSIGWVNEGVNENDLYKLNILSKHHLDIIKSNDGICRIEVDEINTNLISDFDPMTHVNFTPIYHQSKVIIHI